jgi:hypothetical protein
MEEQTNCLRCEHGVGEHTCWRISVQQGQRVTEVDNWETIPPLRAHWKYHEPPPKFPYEGKRKR